MDGCFFIDPILTAKLSFERKKREAHLPALRFHDGLKSAQIDDSPSLKKDRLRPFTHLRPLLLLQPAAAPLH